MTAGPPHLYLITDRRATLGRPLADVVAAALEGAAPAIKRGARVAVALREKDLGARALLDLALPLRAITAAAGAALFINDRLDVALAVGADGVHLGGTSLGPGDVTAVAALAPSLAIAVSIHHPSEVAAAARNAQVAFAVFGPVYATPGKGSPTGISGPDGLRAACGRGLPILALGGVDPGRLPECRAAGAAGAACIRSVMQAPDPAMVVTQFMFSTEF